MTQALTTIKKVTATENGPRISKWIQIDSVV